MVHEDLLNFRVLGAENRLKLGDELCMFRFQALVLCPLLLEVDHVGDLHGEHRRRLTQTHGSATVRCAPRATKTARIRNHCVDYAATAYREDREEQDERSAVFLEVANGGLCLASGGSDGGNIDTFRDGLVDVDDVQDPCHRINEPIRTEQ